MTIRIACIHTAATAPRAREHARALRDAGDAFEVADLAVRGLGGAPARRVAPHGTVAIAHGLAALPAALMAADGDPLAVVYDADGDTPAGAAQLMRRLGAVTAPSSELGAVVQDRLRLPTLPVVT